MLVATRTLLQVRRLSLAAVVALAGCTGDSGSDALPGGPSRIEHPPSVPVANVHHDSLHSAITGIDYPLHVYLPDGYAEGSRSYPVIYATDGQWVFEGFARSIRARGLDVILVAVEQGPHDRRWIDYTLPGAEDYHAFLTTELLPHVEARYRILPEHRTLSGTSLGGLLVGLVLLMDDVAEPPFRNYLSFDGSFYLHQGQTRAIEEARFAASPDLRATLVLTSALLLGNDATVTAFERALEARNYPSLRIIRRSYTVVHDDVAQPSFDEALDLLF